MRKTVRTLGITAALAVMIPLSAYAAATSSSSDRSTQDQEAPPAWSANGGSHEGRGGFRHPGGPVVSQEVLDLLKLDKAAFNEKIKAGSTLAKIAEEQGVTRDSLKKAMTESFNKRLEEQKQNFSNNLDKMIDSNVPVGKFEGGGEGFRFRMAQDLAEVSKLLGLSSDQVKEQLRADKSLADLAKEKGVDVQKLIDVQKASITSIINQAVKDGKLTQEQADKQLANAAVIAEKIVNGKGLGRGQHHGGGRGHGFGGEQPPAQDSQE